MNRNTLCATTGSGLKPLSSFDVMSCFICSEKLAVTEDNRVCKTQLQWSFLEEEWNDLELSMLKTKLICIVEIVTGN